MRNADHRSHETVILTPDQNSVAFPGFVDIRMRMRINTSALFSMGATTSILFNRILSERASVLGIIATREKKQRRFRTAVFARCARQW